MNWPSIVALGLVPAASIAAALARRGFLATIDALERSLEHAPKASAAARTDIPAEVLALASQAQGHG